MSSPFPEVSVIIATLAESARRDSLLNAIDSIFASSTVSVLPIVVVNGKQFCSSLYATLIGMSEIQVIYRKEGSLPGALRAGREAVQSPFFCFLDDDDTYLEGGIDIRLKPMLDDSSIDVVVSSGTRSDGAKFLRTPCQQDPLGSLLKSNWLTSCGGFYRTVSIGSDYFNPEIKYHEWTYLAYKLALEKKIKFIDDLTYHINDSVESLSKSEAYILAELNILKKMHDECPSREHRQIIRKKYNKTAHCISDYFRMKGKKKEAWSFHFKSLLSFEFLKYLPCTRNLISSMSICEKD